MNDPNKPVNRRRFFREGLRELLRPLADAIEPLHEAARQLDRIDNLAQSAHLNRSILPRTIPLNLPQRPPGALDEKSFLQTCSRCGDCVRVCPAQCIKIDPTGVRGGGAPYIDPNDMPCVLCDGLLCMPACPTGALLPTVLNEIDMGTAVWYRDTCLRSHGQDCTICVDRCPVGTFALELRGKDVHVNEDGCTGCGVCQNDCPTSPKSIVVLPKVLRDRGGGFPTRPASA